MSGILGTFRICKMNDGVIEMPLISDPGWNKLIGPYIAIHFSPIMYVAMGE